MPKTYRQEFADVQSAYMEAMEQVRFWGEKFDTLHTETEQLRAQLGTANLEKQGLNTTIDALTMDVTVLAKQVRDARAQLETALKALDRIRLHNDSYVSRIIASEALADIKAGQKGGK